jgi:hypothetical protein
MNVRVRPGFQIIANQLRSFDDDDSVGARFHPDFIFGSNSATGALSNGSALIKLDEAYPFVPPSAAKILESVLELFPAIDSSRVCINLYENGAWTDPNQTLAPGEGVIIYNPGNEFTVTFVGIPLSGELMNYVPAGPSLRSPMIPQSGRISTDQGYLPTPGDTVARMLNGSLLTYTFTVENRWDPSEPSLATGEGVLINAKQASVWTRFFRVFQ